MGVFFGALHVFYPLIFPHAKLGIQANGAALISNFKRRVELQNLIIEIA